MSGDLFAEKYEIIRIRTRWSRDVQSADYVFITWINLFRLSVHTAYYILSVNCNYKM